MTKSVLAVEQSEASESGEMLDARMLVARFDEMALEVRETGQCVLRDNDLCDLEEARSALDERLRTANQPPVDQPTSGDDVPSYREILSAMESMISRNITDHNGRNADEAYAAIKLMERLDALLERNQL